MTTAAVIETPKTPAWAWAATLALLVLGLGMAADAALRSSATYDEVTYLRVAAEWWRTGRQDEITRMGSPSLFWKWQQAPVLFALDRAGFGAMVDRPLDHQPALLPLVRLWSLAFYATALATTAGWARRVYGPRAMVAASAMFALSPNLIGHGALATMEMPLVALTAGLGWLSWEWLSRGSRRAFVGSAALAGLAFSCKYTAILYPALIGACWVVERWRAGDRPRRSLLARSVGLVASYAAIMAASNLAATAFDLAPISLNASHHPSLDAKLSGPLKTLAAHAITTPIPRELAGFVSQARLQGEGGTSYLLGERRGYGWWYYYLVTLAVKVPLGAGLILAARAATIRVRSPHTPGSALIPTFVIGFLTITSIASTRNYGIRYLLPLAPMAIVWGSGLAAGARRSRLLLGVGLVGMGLAVGSIHPHELAYFNEAAGGPRGGRFLLGDSNLDWGQGCKDLAALQADRPELADLTLYYFGDTDPSRFGVRGRTYLVNAVTLPPGFPARLSADTRYVAVSTSLQHGPWGPPGYFGALDDAPPVAALPDWSIVVYRSADIGRPRTLPVPLMPRYDVDLTPASGPSPP